MASKKKAVSKPAKKVRNSFTDVKREPITLLTALLVVLVGGIFLLMVLYVNRVP